MAKFTSGRPATMGGVKIESNYPLQISDQRSKIKILTGS